MPDWKRDVRARLASLELSPTREADIVEELSQHLDDRYRESIAGGASSEEAREYALAGFRAGDLLARQIAALRQVTAAPPITPPTAPPNTSLSPGRSRRSSLACGVPTTWPTLPLPGVGAMHTITTNDNQPAIDFYSGRGWSLRAIHEGAVAEARHLKPEIPHFGHNGVPVRDELEFDLLLSEGSA